MSILIRGIDMPKKGEYKPLFIYDTGEVTMEIRGEEVQVATAVPVPPHGRLIDADALEYEEAYLNGHYELGDVEIVTRKDIESAPTIIPAGEGE